MSGRFKVVKDASGIPFVDGYSVREADRLPEWALRFKRRGLEEYKAAFEAESSGINPRILKFLSENKFARPDERPGAMPDFELLMNTAMFAIEAYTIVFVNGVYVPEASLEEELPFSVCTDRLLNVLTDDPDYLEGRLSEGSGLFAKLNNAYLTDGVAIKVADGEKLERPIHVIHIITKDAGNIFVNPRGYAEIGKGASVKILESHIYMPGVKCFHNRVIDIYVGEGACLENRTYFNVSEDACAAGSAYARIGRGARVDLRYFSRAAGIVDYKIDAELDEGASVRIGMAFEASGKADASYRAAIHHGGAGSRSEVRLAAAAMDSARVHSGTSLSCAKGVRGAEAEHSSKIILFSPGASGRIEPVQLVPGDGVKAVHGAAIGGADRDALFYLESRGIAGAEAADMLRKCVVMEPFSELEDEEVRGEYERIISEK